LTTAGRASGTAETSGKLLVFGFGPDESPKKRQKSRLSQSN
jgi:hypothetical protein